MVQQPYITSAFPAIPGLCPSCNGHDLVVCSERVQTARRLELRVWTEPCSHVKASRNRLADQNTPLDEQPVAAVG